ncbi:MAG TPA: SEC-C metal-binding domain-containing protein [Thermoanaerobaculia bacterium]|jgi:hypothetical protein
MQVGRNEKCPCGSGKKYKNCHADQAQHPAPRGLIYLGLAIAAVAALGIVPALMKDRKPPRRAAVDAPAGAVPAAGSTATATPGSPQPGPAPAGKVWSVEHGHWHDQPPQGAPSASSIRIDGLPTAAPAPGVAPMVATTTSPAQSDIPKTLTPQPPGEVPAGKVWSPEHGHWHDAPKP